MLLIVVLYVFYVMTVLAVQ